MFLLRAVNHPPPNEDQRSRAWDIIRAHGRTSLARYALFSDKSFFFTPGGSVVSYVVKNRVALALGDPIGPIADLSEAIPAFKQFCFKNAWLPVFYQVLPDYLDLYKAVRFNAIAIGQEAVVELSKFTLDGSENKTLRNSYNKLLRLGYCSEVIPPPFSARMLHELETINAEWLISRGTSEMRFLGWFDESYLNTCPVMLVRDREARIEGFANLVTEFQANEIHVDLMRRRRHVEAGLMDFLFVSVFRWARENGYATFNLGLSPLSGVGERRDDPFLERVFNYVYRHASFYNYRGLHRFKHKFHPTWSPRYLIYPGLPSLPAVGISLLKALNADVTITLWALLFRRHR